MSLSAARDATHSIENRSARVPGLLPHIFRGTFSADGDYYLYEDNDVRIGYQQAGDAVILIYSPKADTVGGHTSFEKEREVGPGKRKSGRSAPVSWCIRLGTAPRRRRPGHSMQ
jgi:hypothetical protein